MAGGEEGGSWGEHGFPPVRGDVRVSEFEDLYREVIIDHYKNPRNYGLLDPHDAHAEGQNPLFAGVGGDFPVVMDAAFGNLDDDYRRQIANVLPDLTSQVVVLTSKAQAAGVVEQQLASRVGKKYSSTTYTTRRDLQDVTEQISVAGRSYPYQVIGSDWDGAEVTEVQA